MAHDLKEPLRSIATLTDMVFEGIEQHRDAAAKDGLRRIQVATKRLAAVIDAVLRAPGDGTASSACSVDMSHLLAEISDTLGEPADAVHARIRVEGSMGQVPGDRRTLLSLFSNLISNGLRHNHGPEPHVSVRRRHRSYGEEYLVEDNGPGLRDNPYEGNRGPVVREKRRTRGAMIVRRALSVLKATLWIEARQPAPGTIVHVLLPNP